MKKLILVSLFLISTASFAGTTLSAEAFCQDWASLPVTARLMNGNYMLNPILNVQEEGSAAVVTTSGVRLGTLQADWKQALLLRCGATPATSNAGGFFPAIVLDKEWAVTSSHQEACVPNIIDEVQQGFVRIISDSYTLANAETNSVIQLGSVFHWAGDCQP